MNALQQARNAYARTAPPTRTERDSEYELIARITGRLRAAARDGDFPALIAALHDNQRLWTRLATSVADTGNALPDQLRGQMLSLANFVIRHSGELRAGRASAEPLIEINTAVMRGLRGDASA